MSGNLNVIIVAVLLVLDGLEPLAQAILMPIARYNFRLLYSKS